MLQIRQVYKLTEQISTITLNDKSDKFQRLAFFAEILRVKYFLLFTLLEAIFSLYFYRSNHLSCTFPAL